MNGSFLILLQIMTDPTAHMFSDRAKRKFVAQNEIRYIFSLQTGFICMRVFHNRKLRFLVFPFLLKIANDLKENRFRSESIHADFMHQTKVVF